MFALTAGDLDAFQGSVEGGGVALKLGEHADFVIVGEQADLAIVAGQKGLEQGGGLAELVEGGRAAGRGFDRQQHGNRTADVFQGEFARLTVVGEQEIGGGEPGHAAALGIRDRDRHDHDLSRSPERGRLLKQRGGEPFAAVQSHCFRS
ncbi:MAG: hypothetical protein QM757_35480 [Paludibaculum sp.]